MEAQARRRTLWKGMGKGISHPHVCFVFASGILLPLLAGLEKYLEVVTFCNPIALEQILSIGGFQRVAVFFVKVGGGEYRNTVLQYCCRLLWALTRRRSPWVSCVDEKLPSSSSQPSFGLRWVFEPERPPLLLLGRALAAEPAWSSVLCSCSVVNEVTSQPNEITHCVVKW